MLKYVFLALIGSLILAVSSKIKILLSRSDDNANFSCFNNRYWFCWKLGLATISLYLFEGIVGLPVFAGTPEKGIGLIYFTGPTMGYLLGFSSSLYFWQVYL